ncbi:Demethylspheroidene O-methyltransferase [Novipirellula galeiformis]|uniref:Demethylspheroidene O-methyltransferase n=1 Tax=Novipirellula galeiformis TaxID=2528004 RepID=A0A5C6BFJ4_9BACT|nr:methyltransferase [Novipirellula galeiformis]TWU10076.1 Demethylspheroidene O-methyltransferase [Novipirellula galeiformis]
MATFKRHPSPSTSASGGTRYGTMVATGVRCDRPLHAAVTLLLDERYSVTPLGRNGAFVVTLFPTYILEPAAMSASAIQPPRVDPTPIFEHFRGSYGSELLTAAVAHFDLFGRLAERAMAFDELANELGLQSRPANVLVTALRAMGLLEENEGLLRLTPMASEHLVPGARLDCGDYLSLAAQAPGVLSMVQLLKSNKPIGSDGDAGTAFIYRGGAKSAMDAEASARHFTLALAGRAKNVAPALADALPLCGPQTLLDLGGGTGIYSFALLQKHPQLRAVVFDRPDVLKVAQEFAETYGVSDRVELIPGDMFSDPLPENMDAVLLSNILHDWDVPECKTLIGRCVDALKPAGRLFIHDVFLDDSLDGPLPIALYSAALFSLTEGRAYSEAEYRSWMEAAGLKTEAKVPTLVHCGVVEGIAS